MSFFRRRKSKDEHKNTKETYLPDKDIFNEISLFYSSSEAEVRSQKGKRSIQEDFKHFLGNGWAVKDNKLIPKLSELGRIFDLLPKKFFENQFNFAEGVKNLKEIVLTENEKARERMLSEFCNKLLATGYSVFLTKEGDLKPSFFALLNKYTENTFSSNYLEMSKETQEKIKAQFIFSLTHSVFKDMQKELEKDENIMKIPGKNPEGATSQPPPRVLNIMMSTHDLLSKPWTEIEKIRENFLMKTQEELIRFISGYLKGDSNLDKLALDVIIDYNLPLKIDKGRLAISPKDQLLRFIGREHPEIIDGFIDTYQKELRSEKDLKASGFSIKDVDPVIFVNIMYIADSDKARALNKAIKEITKEATTSKKSHP